VKEVASKDDLKKALEDAGVTEIDITDSINGGESLDVTAKADNTPESPGGKDTDRTSLKLAKGSHVTIKNATDKPGSGGQSVRAALAAADWIAEGWAILVIWNYFEIPDGATFDLIGKVRLIFRTTAGAPVTVKVDGDLMADTDGAIAVEQGVSAPVITGSGTVTVGNEIVKNAEDETANIETEVPYTPPTDPDPDDLIPRSPAVGPRL
jgi:hypothetical protein